MSLYVSGKELYRGQEELYRWTPVPSGYGVAMYSHMTELYTLSRKPFGARERTRCFGRTA